MHAISISLDTSSNAHQPLWLNNQICTTQQYAIPVTTTSTFNASRSTQSFVMQRWHTGHRHHWQGTPQLHSRSRQSLIVTFDYQRQCSGGHSRCHPPRRWLGRCIDGRMMQPWRCLVWIYGGVPLRSWWGSRKNEEGWKLEIINRCNGNTREDSRSINVTHFWALYSSRIELSLLADCAAAIDSCRWLTRATEEADDEAARRRDDETMVEIIILMHYLLIARERLLRIMTEWIRCRQMRWWLLRTTNKLRDSSRGDVRVHPVRT